MNLFDGSRDGSLLFVAVGRSFSLFFWHDLSVSDDDDVLVGKFLFEFSDQFFLDFSPSRDLRSGDRDDDSVSSTNVEFFGSDHVKLHQLFFDGFFSVVLNVQNGLAALGFDAGGFGASPLDHFLVD